MSECSKCALLRLAEQTADRQCYTYTPHEAYESPVLSFDVQRGYELARAGVARGESWRQRTMDCTDAEVRDFVERHNIIPEHIEHAATDEPSLMGLIYLRRKDKSPAREIVSVLLDGHHRALRHFNAGRDAPIYILLPAEMASLIWMIMDPKEKIAVEIKRRGANA